jgi:hypothetical protein
MLVMGRRVMEADGGGKAEKARSARAKNTTATEKDVV